MLILRIIIIIIIITIYHYKNKNKIITYNNDDNFINIL